MSQRTQTVCDECGTVTICTDPKSWHRVGLYTETALLLGPTTQEIAEGLLISTADLCGDSCLHKFIDRKLKIGAHRPDQPAKEPDGEQEKE